ncbi:MAG: class I SAM-dependent methyltransferase [Candidatus Limivivens sp.]|nr:class I SAM-dependent methyltransferase [Candidatus Limivivens sp.]
MQGQLKELEHYWTNRAEGYSLVNQEELAGEQRQKWLRYLTERFPDRSPETISVLDVGTGPGFFAIILAEAGYLVTAVDYTAEMMKQARKNAGDLAASINWEIMDAQNLTFAEKQFDVIVSRNLTWNLDEPARAYGEWYRVLKEGGTLLNFDANWYAYLFDEEKRLLYEADRANVASLELEDQYTCTDIETMEGLARKMPLSQIQRPEWDRKVLSELGFSSVRIEEDMGDQVYSFMEKINNAATPLFCVQAWK